MKHKRPPNMTKNSDIAAYWATKWLHADGSVTNDKKDDGILVSTDIGEPECFICEMPLQNKFYTSDIYLKTLEQDNKNNTLTLWDLKEVKQTFERAHIIPYALGGKDEPSNYMLLCNRCHKYAPNTNNYSQFIKHVYTVKTSHYFRKGIPEKILFSMAETMTNLGVNEPEDVTCIFNKIEKDDPLGTGKITWHWGETVNDASWIAYLTEIIKEYAQEKSKSSN